VPKQRFLVVIAYARRLYYILTNARYCPSLLKMVDATPRPHCLALCGASTKLASSRIRTSRPRTTFQQPRAHVQALCILKAWELSQTAHHAWLPEAARPLVRLMLPAATKRHPERTGPSISWGYSLVERRFAGGLFI